ncbi:MAG: radical SAM protein [Acidobacteriota bacterium]|nr:radical SAM protein [Acidobacteriota bacterium]
MNILLVSARRSAYTGESISAPHQGVLSLAAVLREGTFFDTRGVQVEVLDDQLFVIDRPWAPPSACLAGRNPDVVGVQVSTSSLKNGVRLLDEVRARFPKALTVLGGVGAGPLAAQLVENEEADVVVAGEAEVSFSQLIYLYEQKGRAALPEVQGITYLNGDGKAVQNPAPMPIHDFDALPLPARDLIDMDLYRRISRGRAGNLLTSRGCSYACSYCYSRHHWGRGQRNFSLDRVMHEVRVLVEEYGIDRIRIEDDDFLEQKKWVFDFCDTLEAAGYSRFVEWEMKARPDHIDEETVRRLRRAGCFRILMGVETLNPDLLKTVARPLKEGVLENALDHMRQGGIGVQATLILGIPGESDAAMRYTLQWLEERVDSRRHDIVSPCFFVPFTPQVQAAMSQQCDYTLEVHDTDCFTGHIPVTSSPACSLEELNRLYEDMAPTRRGKYQRIAHLAPLEEVQNRVSEEVAAGASPS